MNKSQFQLLKQYAGLELLNYILSCDKITDKSDYDQLELLPVQVQVLDDLYIKIQECRIQYIKQDGFGDEFRIYLSPMTISGMPLLNYYRQICGGVIVSPDSSDPLVSYLQQICIKEYPNLLMKSQGILGQLLSINAFKTLINNDEFINLVKNDDLNKLTNKKEGNDYAFQFSTTDGLHFCLDLFTACNSIITRSFYDSCNRMAYSLPSVLKAIEENINLLRRLANGERVSYSSFIGIRGLQFQGFETIELPGGILRRFRDSTNPSIHTNRTVVSHSGDQDGEYRYSGHIFEIFHSTEISFTPSEFNTSNSIETNRFQETELQKLQFSAVFSSLANYGPVPTLSEIGFPLIIPGNYGVKENFPTEYILINEETKDKLIEWYSCLSNKDLTQIQTPLKRLQYAIFERNNPEDAIVDAIIAWEGMFSEAFETTFKVTGSIAKFLRSGAERDTFFKRLKKLYGFRSELVHGGDRKSLKKENIQEVRAEVIDIGLECLKKIINSDYLLSLTSIKRMEAILIFDEPT